MSAPSRDSLTTARRLWAHTADGPMPPEAVAAAAERTCAALRLGLRRWIGADGYRSLLQRSLTQARAAHPALEGLSCLGLDESEMLTAAQRHGADKVEAALVALVAALIDTLGRILGEELAAHLVEQAGRGTLRDDGPTASNGAHDG